MQSTIRPTLTVMAAADILNVHSSTVEKLIGSGVLPAAKVGRAWVIMTKDVLNYAEKLVIEQTTMRRGLELGTNKSPERRRQRRAA